MVPGSFLFPEPGVRAHRYAHAVAELQTWTREGLARAGFEGFEPLATLPTHSVPKLPGVYIVLREETGRPVFLERSIAGHFKGVDCTVQLAVLEAAWVNLSSVVYIGKARWGKKQDGLRRRLSQYRRYGAGKAVGHRGGEYIWQLQDSSRLLVCWKVVPDDEVDELEGDLIDSFEDQHGRWPFANRKHERRRIPPGAVSARHSDHIAAVDQLVDRRADVIEVSDGVLVGIDRLALVAQQQGVETSCGQR